VATATKRKAAPRAQLNGKAPHRYIFNGQIQLPAEFPTLSSFRRWCLSPDYPERGEVFWIDGDIWVSDEMGDFLTHNAIKTEVLTVLNTLVKAGQLGYMFSDRMRLVHPRASLSVEPDLMFASFASVQSKRIRLKPNKKNRILEVVGSPDMVLEVASDSSVPKDDRLEQKYFAAGVSEYWRIDARGEQLKFDILTRGPKGFVAGPRQNGRVRSDVFGRSFDLLAKAGPIGVMELTLDVGRLVFVAK
jgi:Uma2 family endonuclease